MSREISRPAGEPHTDVLDHASEFVTMVYSTAPSQYRRMLESDRYQQLIETTKTFNYGKLYAYAEFVVFRKEFIARFPDASQHACVNAFSKLLLKNDISITNLVNFIEGSLDEEITLLESKAPGKPGGEAP